MYAYKSGSYSESTDANIMYWNSGCFTLHYYDYYCLKLPEISIIEQPQMDVKYSDKGQHQEYLQSERCLHGIQRSVFSVPIYVFIITENLK